MVHTVQILNIWCFSVEGMSQLRGLHAPSPLPKKINKICIPKIPSAAFLQHILKGCLSKCDILLYLVTCKA